MLRSASVTVTEHDPTLRGVAGSQRGGDGAARDMTDTEGPSEPISRVGFVVRRGADLGADGDDLLLVYAAATNPNGEDVRDRGEIMRRHATYPDAVGVVALGDDGFVGFAYGTRSQRGQWWHDHVSAALGPADRDRWLRDAFGLRELAVLPAVQGQGIGRALVQRLLGQPEADQRRTVVLSAEMDDPVDRLYRSEGFEDVLVDLPFHPDGPRFRVMGRERPVASG